MFALAFSVRAPPSPYIGEAVAKAVAKFIAPSVDEDGVYRALVELGVIDG